MLVVGIHDLLGDAPGSSRANEPACVHAQPLELVNGVADRCRDLARLANVPREATDIIPLAHRKHQHLRM